MLGAEPEPRRASIAEINRGRGTADQGGNHVSYSHAGHSVSQQSRGPLVYRLRLQSKGGTADEAKAMLMKAVAAVKADKANRDLYVFCFNASDGKQVANGNPNAKQLMGVDARTIKDAHKGKAFGAELYAAYQKPGG